MEGLANKWKALLQSQSAQQNKFSRYKPQQPKSKNKESIGLYLEEQSKLKESKEKNKNSRTKSNEQKKYSQSKLGESNVKLTETPNKSTMKKQDKIIDRYTNSIVDLLEDNQPHLLRGKVKALLEDLTANIGVQNNMNSSLRVSVGDRAYHELQLKYLQSQKERQYLKGKMEISSKRYQGLERQLERYSKIQKLIDSSINRENELRQEINRVKAEKSLLEAQMEQQNLTFSKQVQSIKELIQSLKMHLPIN